MTTRSQKTGVKLIDKIPTKKRVENSWVLLAKDSLLDDNKQFSVVTLPHPGSGILTRYCLDQANRKIFEVAVYDEPNRSWFIGDTVKSDGKLHMTTVVNPTFLLLPRLIEDCSTRAIPLEDLLCEKGFDKILDFIPNLEHVADLKGPANIRAYKYNEKKALVWLEARVRGVAGVLRTKNIRVTSGAVSATFVTSGKDDIEEEFYLKYAHGLVSQYLPEQLSEALEKHFNFKPELVETLSKKRKSEADETMDRRKILKTEPGTEQKENSVTSPNGNVAISNIKALKPAALTSKEKARQKAASGTKTISSFFTKK